MNIAVFLWKYFLYQFLITFGTGEPQLSRVRLLEIGSAWQLNYHSRSLDSEEIDGLQIKTGFSQLNTCFNLFADRRERGKFRLRQTITLHCWHSSAAILRKWLSSFVQECCNWVGARGVWDEGGKNKTFRCKSQFKFCNYFRNVI